MRFKTSLKSTSTLIDLTPLVDVMFLLLVFFLLTSEILPLKSLAVENPTLDVESPTLTAQVLVIMDAQQVLYVGHQKDIVDMASLSEAIETEIARVQREHPGANPTVVLSVDRGVDYGAFLRLFSLAQETGNRVRLVYHNPTCYLAPPAGSEAVRMRNWAARQAHIGKICARSRRTVYRRTGPTTLPRDRWQVGLS